MTDTRPDLNPPTLPLAGSADDTPTDPQIAVPTLPPVGVAASAPWGGYPSRPQRPTPFYDELVVELGRPGGEPEPEPEPGPLLSPIYEELAADHPPIQPSTEPAQVFEIPAAAHGTLAGYVLGCASECCLAAEREHRTGSATTDEPSPSS